MCAESIKLASVDRYHQPPSGRYLLLYVEGVLQ
jgi:hypothetical protein